MCVWFHIVQYTVVKSACYVCFRDDLFNSLFGKVVVPTEVTNNT